MRTLGVHYGASALNLALVEDGIVLDEGPDRILVPDKLATSADLDSLRSEITRRLVEANVGRGAILQPNSYEGGASAATARIGAETLLRLVATDHGVDVILLNRATARSKLGIGNKGPLEDHLAAAVGPAVGKYWAQRRYAAFAGLARENRTMSPLAGEAEGRPTYEVLEQWVAGSDRDVYLAKHAIFQRLCIQKAVLLNGLGDSVFMNEPQLVEKLDHPHIVRISEAQFDPQNDGRVTFVMPAYEGGNLWDRLRRDGVFSVASGLTLAEHVADALAYLHTSFQFAHRDVKGANVLLDATEQSAFLADFGSAARFNGGRVATAGFTLPYLDPAAYGAMMTARSDVYSTGMMLFEMLSGWLAPQFEPDKAHDRFMKGLRAFPDSVLAHRAHVPAPVRRLVNKAMNADPSKRFASAADFATAIDRAKARVIDWSEVSVAGLEGEWQGTWPPNRPVVLRRTYRVVSTRIERGSNAGRLRLEASFSTDNRTWRRFGGLSQVVSRDRTAVSQFFDTVDEVVAQIRAAQ